MNKEEIKQYIKDNLKLECETYLNKWYEEFRVITLKLEDVKSYVEDKLNF